MADEIFEREELLSIGRCCGHAAVVQGKEERVGVGDPKKTRGLDAAPHGDAVCEHRTDVGLIENPGWVLIAVLLLDPFAGLIELLETSGIERRRRVESVESFPGCAEEREVRAQGGWVGLRFEIGDGERVKFFFGRVERRSEDRMCVVVDHGDGVDDPGQVGIDAWDGVVGGVVTAGAGEEREEQRGGGEREAVTILKHRRWTK